MTDQIDDPRYIALGQKLRLLPAYMTPGDLSKDDKAILRKILSKWDVLNEIGLAWDHINSDDDIETDEEESDDEEDSISPFGCLYESSDDEDD